MASTFRDAFASAEAEKKTRARKPGKVARADKEAKNEPKNGKPVEVEAEAQKPVETARDRWARVTKDVAGATGLREKIADSNGLLDDPDSVRTFARIVGELDALAVYKLTLDLTDNGDPIHSSEREAETAWFDLTWEEQATKLAGWSEGAELLRAFNFWTKQENNAFAQDSLCNVVSRFDRPLRHTTAFGGLKNFLDDAVEEGLFVKVNKPDPGRRSDYGVYIPTQDGKGETLYLPKKGLKLAAAGWVFVKDAETRASKTQSALNALRSRETPGITPVKISNGLLGCMFVQLGATQAVLLESNFRSGWPAVRVIDSVGMKPDQVPSDDTEWDEKLHRPKTHGKWVWIVSGIEEWKTRREAQRRGERQEKNERTAPLTKLITSNFSPRIEDQGLTRMLEGESGVMAIWMERFKWGREGDKKEAFFGIAIERKPDGTFFLLEVATRHLFPYKKLVGSQLPLEVDAETPSVRLLEISVRDKAVYAGLKMVEILLRLRLNAEAPDEYDDDEETVPPTEQKENA